MTLIPSYSPAILALSDGTVFKGCAIGAPGSTSGEVVFNTAMSGYQEILSDPAYCQQIVTMTYPHIGNAGCNDEDFESRANFIAGLVIRDLPIHAENWRMNETLSDYLKKHEIIAIAGIDTRKLTRLLREKGTQTGCIMAGVINEAEAIAVAKAAPSLQGLDLVKMVTTDKPYAWNEGVWNLQGYTLPGPRKYHVAVYDFGIKRSILRILAMHECQVTVVPAHTSADEVLKLNPDGIFLSNGPGDPESCSYAQDAIRKLLDSAIPIFGLCFGHQMLALASGAKTVKMKFGHHGSNHPVKDLVTGKVMITNQSHSFVVDQETLPENLQPTHISLFDGSLQGAARTDVPAFSFQGHLAASSGPDGMDYLFDRFKSMMQDTKVREK